MSNTNVDPANAEIRDMLLAEVRTNCIVIMILKRRAL